MYNVSFSDLERFHLRILLSATRFIDLKTYKGVMYPTFKKALLISEWDWLDCFEEASIFQMPTQFRQLFAYICIFLSSTT